MEDHWIARALWSSTMAREEQVVQSEKADGLKSDVVGPPGVHVLETCFLVW